MKSLIQKIRDKKLANEDHISEITGVSWVPKPDYYRNTETGEEFFDIFGALSWPAGDRPGFAVVVGVVKGGDPQEPALKALDEIESPSVEGLLKECVDLRTKWGFPDLLKVWLGDQERFLPIVTDFNANRRSEDLLVVTVPYDFEKPNRGEIYLQRIFELLKPGASGKKRLSLGGCNKLRGNISDFPHGAAQIGQVERWPAVAALGYAVHTMLVYKPWLRFLKPQKLVSTVPDDELLSRPLREQQEIMKLLNLVWEDDESDDDGGDGGLISTL